MTPKEKEDIILGLVEALVTDAIAVDFVPWEQFDPQFERDVMALVLHERRRRARLATKAQRRALKLLRMFLTKEQQKQMRDRKFFLVRGSEGGMYRIFPYWGTIFSIEQHGKHWYAKTSYCLHDPDRQMPTADVSFGQMLWLLNDEAEFLRTANARTTEVVNPGWNGAWRRRLAAARQERRDRQRDLTLERHQQLLEVVNGQTA